MRRAFRSPEQQASPVYPTRLSSKEHDTRKSLVDAAFITLRAGYMVFSSLRSELIPADPPRLEEINSCLRSRDRRRFNEMSITPAANGFVLAKMTHGFLADFSVRLKVPTDGSPNEYHEEAFNVDFQCAPSKPVNLVGDDKIRRNPDAVIELLSFERDIVYAGLTNWVGFGVDTTQSVRC